MHIFSLPLALFSFFFPQAPVTTAESLKIIDAHIHTRFTGDKERTSGISMTQEELFKEFAKAGVVGAVAHAGPDEDGTEPGSPPDLRQKGVIHCAGVPAMPDPVEMERRITSGRFRCFKIYLGYVHQYANDPAYHPIYKLAEKYDIPVVFHTGDTYSIDGKVKFADPLTIDEVAVDFRKVTFVIAHMGNPWIQSAAEVAYKNPNVYVEGSALLIGDLSKAPRDKVAKYVTEPVAWTLGYLEDPSKLLFGTDWPLTDIPSYVDAFKRAIPKEHWQAVFHDNAVKVFKLNR